MTVGREPAGYRLAREVRRRGWSLKVKTAFMDYGHKFGVAIQIDDENGQLVVRTAAAKRHKRRFDVSMNEKIELRAIAARELLEKLPC